MAGSPKPVRRRTAITKVKKEEATKGTDLNGREPLGAGGKWIMEKVGADLNGREPTISKMVIKQCNKECGGK